MDSTSWREASDGIRSKGNDRSSMALATYSSEGARYNDDISKAPMPAMKDIGVELKINAALFSDLNAT